MPRKPKLKSEKVAESESAGTAESACTIAPPGPIAPLWARIPDVIERSHISENTIRRRMKDGLIRSSKVHGIQAIDVRSVEAMFAAGAQK